MLVPIQETSTFAALRATPCCTTAGKVTPTGVSAGRSNEPTTCATVRATAAGVEGCGVGIRTRSAANAPVVRSTGAPLMPLPPMSIPNAMDVLSWLLMAGSGSPLRCR
ncbi:hypothetical protein GALL_353380 [mine drainage metagenome]|uniref:Uncharacterized protein n=1 Tax=mine drainage metagenome TaxID=410659 RepID=A0A1J5R3Y9_9ZZZZ